MMRIKLCDHEGIRTMIVQKKITFSDGSSITFSLRASFFFVRTVLSERAYVVQEILFRKKDN